MAKDPSTPDRLWMSLLDWLDGQDILDREKRVVHSLSTGGYYGMRVTHTHGERLAGAVSQGGWCHRIFEREWLDAVDHLDYAFE